MSPEKAKIFLAIGGDDKARGLCRWTLEVGGRFVVIEAGDLQTALESIEQAKKSGVNVAVLAGNLTPEDISCKDGRDIAEALRQAIPDIKIVAFSGSPETADYGDVLIKKEDINAWFGRDELIKTIGSL